MTQQLTFSAEVGIRRQHALSYRVGTWLGLALGVGGIVLILRTYPRVLSATTLYWSILAVVLLCLTTTPAFFSYWRAGLLLWWFLLSSEQLFSRAAVSEQEALAGAFSVSAYSEVGMWALISVLLGALVIGSGYNLVLHSMRGPNKWSTFVVLSAVASVAYSYTPVFSGLWCCKLALTVILLQWIASQVVNVRQIFAFLRVTWLALVFLCVMPVFEALGYSQSFFQDGRIGSIVNPVSVSQRGAMLLLLSLCFYYSGQRKSIAVGGSVLATAVMCLGGGKTAIVAGVISASLLAAMMSRSLKAAAQMLTMIGAGLCTLVITPVSAYLRDYLSYGGTDTLSGRTDLWHDALPLIYDRLFVGHGYMTSRFVGLQLNTEWNPGQLHNFCLDVLYCTGIIGFFILVCMIIATVCNIVKTMRCSASRQYRLVASAFLCVVLNQLVNGMTEATIGGRPSSGFVVLLAITCFSGILAHHDRSSVSMQKSQPTRPLYKSGHGLKDFA